MRAKRETKFRPLPPLDDLSLFDVARQPPFQLDLASVLPSQTMAAMTKAGKITFHLNGDMGGIGQPMQSAQSSDTRSGER